MRLYQQGAHKEDATWDDEFHFDTAKKARKAGFDPGADVNWQASLNFNEAGKPYPGDNYFEWSGW